MTDHSDEIRGALESFLHDYGTGQGMTMSPGSVEMFHFDQPTVLAKSADPEWFSLRVFNSNAEMHIERIQHTGGLRVDVLTDQTAQHNQWVPLGQYQRLLWRVAPTTTGGYELRDARTAVLPVPIAGSTGNTKAGQVVLTAMEYITFDAHGNAAVVCERLTGFDEVRDSDNA